MLKDDAMKKVTEDMLTDFFRKNYRHFEDMVLRFNPRVLILEEKTKVILSQQYVITERHIRINNNLFPYYTAGEIETYREEITQLALLPYRGIQMPYIISFIISRPFISATLHSAISRLIYLNYTHQ